MGVASLSFLRWAVRLYCNEYIIFLLVSQEESLAVQGNGIDGCMGVPMTASLARGDAGRTKKRSSLAKEIRQ